MARLRFLGLCSLLLWAFVSAGTESGVITERNPDRVLRAATRRSDVFRRNSKIEQKFAAEFAYVEGENEWSNLRPFSSRIKVGSESPVLVLEEIEHHLLELQCAEDSLKLRFADQQSARDAMHACAGGSIITSHDGCNAEGERSVYKVHQVGVAEDGFALHLNIVKTQWKHAFSSFGIDFGHTSDFYVYRRHSDFRKARKRAVASATTSLSASPLTIPDDTPDGKTNVTFNLNQNLIDTVFDQSSFTAGLDQFLNLPSLPLELGCRNCTTAGSITLTQGAIQIDTKQIDLVPDVFEGKDDNKDVLKVITGGYFHLEATDVSAHVELFARPRVSGAFTVSLPALPIAAFVIPGIGKAGVTFEVSLDVNYELTKPGIEVTYGFDVVVPKNAAVTVQLSDLAGSKVVGFPEARLTPITPVANISDVEIVLGAAFVPAIPIGFEFLDQLEASVGVAMDLPRLDLRLATQKNANADCSPLPNNNSTNSTAPYANSTTVALNGNASLADAFTNLGPLVLVDANVSLSLDVDMALNVSILPGDLGSFETSVNLLQTTFNLGSTCLAANQGWQTAGSQVHSTTAWTGSATSVTSIAAAGTATERAEVTLSQGYTAIATPPSLTPSAQAFNCTSSIIYVAAAPTLSTLAPAATPLYANSTLPAASVFLTTTSVNTNGTGLPQFSGAALPALQVPVLNGAFAWQALLISVAATVGGMMML